MSIFDGSSILITGGTGSFGKAFVDTVLSAYKPERIVVFSRDELKQFEMRQQFPIDLYPNLRFFIGDIRDRHRLYRALDGVQIVVHAAAMKQVPTAEYNPIEAVKTNINGAANVIDAAIDRNVSKVLALSTDKAANPVNLYGATKLCSDKLFVAANSYSGLHRTRFSAVRYGNVVGSRGSVIPYFLSQRESGCLTITDERMTRFLITLDEGVEFVLRCLEFMKGGEVFVPKIPSVKIIDLARIVAPDCDQKIIGIRPGEKLHETMISEDDARLSLEFLEHYVIQPSHSFWNPKDYLSEGNATAQPCSEGFVYRSDTNTSWLSDEEIYEMVSKVEQDISPRRMPKASEPKFNPGG